MDGNSTFGNPVFDLAVVVMLILVGGFFAASEIALITVKRHRLAQLAEDGSGAARTAHRLTDDPSRFLATIQIAITFLGFLAGATGAVAFSGGLADQLRRIPLPLLQDAAGEIAFVTMTLVIALASIIVGELVPKTLALSFPERFALFVARPVGVLDRILSPVVWFVSTSSKVLVRMLGGKLKPQPGYLSTEELKMLVESSAEQGEFEEDEKEMIHGVIELGDKRVHEVMVPRIGIRAVNVDDPLDEVLDMIVRAGHSRVPVFEESLDNIVGILYAKDLLPYLKRNGGGNGPIDIRALVRPPVYVPESKAVDELLHDMQAQKRHIAIVVDEYGGTAGLITMEDVVEEIVGEIQDEYDSEVSMVEPIETDDGLAFRLDGRVSMDDLRDLFELTDDDEPDEEAYDTVGGFIVHRAGRIPLPRTEIPFRDGVVLQVEAAEPRRVAKVVASRQPENNGEDDPPTE
ncbi:MAG TPA: hemolysin family protein [Methylomirabilota bacterium]|nr:hemolysin family protein [Methylomirabilota bacterium]